MDNIISQLIATLGNSIKPEYFYEGWVTRRNEWEMVTQKQGKVKEVAANLRILDERLIAQRQVTSLIKVKSK